MQEDFPNARSMNFPVGNLGKSPEFRSLGPGSLLQHSFPFQDLEGLRFGRIQRVAA